MKKLLYTVSMLFVALGMLPLTSCNKEESLPGVLSVKETSVSFAAAGEQKTITVIAENVSWQATTDAEWLTLENAQGTAAGVVKVTAQPNKTPNVMSAKIVLSAAGVEPVWVEVTQESSRLSTEETEMSFVYAGEQKSFTVIADDISWQATTDAEWLTLENAQGTAGGVVTVTARPNTTPSVLTAQIVLSAAGFEPVAVEVTQDHRPFIQSDFYGTYQAEYDKWDIEGKTAFYEILEGGDYGATITGKKFCEDYAAAYNADKKPTTPVTAEDCTYNWYDDTRYTRFDISENEFSMIRYVQIAGEGNGMLIYEIQGAYTYDAEKQVFTIHDVAIADEPRDIDVAVADFVYGKSLGAAVEDFYWWCAVSYDGATQYLPYCKTTYTCKKVK